jgi:integrase
MLNAVHVSFAPSIVFARSCLKKRVTIVLTMHALFDRDGQRKYLVARERLAFATAAIAEGGAVATFCLTLAFTGARISEVLALVPERIDVSDDVIVFETLKQRKKGIYRALPVPRELLNLLEATHELSLARIDPERKRARLWPWGRTTAWKHVKRVMRRAGITDAVSKPKALRHGFAVEAGQNGVQLNFVQRWLGHARIETTAIYAAALGKEERALARRTWRSLQNVLKNP